MVELIGKGPRTWSLLVTLEKQMFWQVLFGTRFPCNQFLHSHMRSFGPGRCIFRRVYKDLVYSFLYLLNKKAYASVKCVGGEKLWQIVVLTTNNPQKNGVWMVSGTQVGLCPLYITVVKFNAILAERNYYNLLVTVLTLRSYLKLTTFAHLTNSLQFDKDIFHLNT